MPGDPFGNQAFSSDYASNANGIHCLPVWIAMGRTEDVEKSGGQLIDAWHQNRYLPDSREDKGGDFDLWQLNWRAWRLRLCRHRPDTVPHFLSLFHGAATWGSSMLSVALFVTSIALSKWRGNLPASVTMAEEPFISCVSFPQKTLACWKPLEIDISVIVSRKTEQARYMLSYVIIINFVIVIMTNWLINLLSVLFFAIECYWYYIIIFFVIVTIVRCFYMSRILSLPI